MPTPASASATVSTSAPRTVLIVGFGNIGQSVVPLIRQRWPDWRIIAIDQQLDRPMRRAAEDFGVHLLQQRITPNNHECTIGSLLQPGDLLLNLAVEVSSRALIGLAQGRGAHYLDTCIDPWQYDNGAGPLHVSNYTLREEILSLQAESGGRATAVVAHGANPGFISILAKHALLRMAQRFLPERQAPRTRSEWAALARELGIRVIQVSERDTQVGREPRRHGEFVNTWSVDGFVAECLQPAELGWGTHERRLPPGALVHAEGCRAAIALAQPGHEVRVRSWSPNALDFEAYLISHNEAISIADYLSCDIGTPQAYRPTAYYAYHPCDDAMASMPLLREGAGGIATRRVLKHEIVSGIDELGVFLISDRWPAVWLGSNLSIGKARQQAPHNSATSLQVASAIVAGLQWMLLNPAEGVVESEAMDHALVYDLAASYWAPMVCEFVDWRPRADGPDLQFDDFLARTPATP